MVFSLAKMIYHQQSSLYFVVPTNGGQVGFQNIGQQSIDQLETQSLS